MMQDEREMTTGFRKHLDNHCQDAVRTACSMRHREWEHLGLRRGVRGIVTAGAAALNVASAGAAGVNNPRLADVHCGSGPEQRSKNRIRACFSTGATSGTHEVGRIFPRRRRRALGGAPRMASIVIAVTGEEIRGPVGEAIFGVDQAGPSEGVLASGGVA
jgi:hypothetical protein